MENLTALLAGVVVLLALLVLAISLRGSPPPAPRPAPAPVAGEYNRSAAATVAEIRRATEGRYVWHDGSIRAGVAQGGSSAAAEAVARCDADARCVGVTIASDGRAAAVVAATDDPALRLVVERSPYAIAVRGPWAGRVLAPPRAPPGEPPIFKTMPIKKGATPPLGPNFSLSPELKKGPPMKNPGPWMPTLPSQKPPAITKVFAVPRAS